MNRRYDVCIIGGGAAGLACAASIGHGISTCILEKNEILGRKILATGGGRCNLTNAGCAGVSATLDFFALQGLETCCDSEGRYYPYSECAADVVRVLRDSIDDTYCNIMTSTAVLNVSAREDSFRVETDQGPVTADAVVIASGGKAGPQFGTTGDGYRLAKELGHHNTRLYPILTGIECGAFSDLKGIRARGVVRLYRDGEMLGEEKGQIQFTADGVSGICVFNLTPMIRAEEGEKPRDAMRRYELSLDLAPDFTPDQLQKRNSVFGIVTGPLAERLDAETIKDWRLPVRGIKGWREAQCTAGGIRLDEIDPKTQESLLVPGLYFAGEILDIQGPCGGYNLQNAWETGMRAAAAINERAGAL
ncbi:MAG: NAD(P)/FAD-dependent oxidoreductase [Firmicutes bacterium]|nr:NAD(P)/FAD-dependent oxidoreductase [Bacillota bacterium]